MRCYCILKSCKNTSNNCNKTFIQVPHNPERRKKWLKAIGREYHFSDNTTTIFVCEDHFDLEQDMENYMRWKLIGGVKLMKKNVCPHKNLGNLRTDQAGSQETKNQHNENSEIKKRDFGVMVKPTFRSKYVQTNFS